jgi:hypothetical protein
MKFGLLLTSMDAITYADIRDKKNEDTYMRDVTAVIRGEI